MRGLLSLVAVFIGLNARSLVLGIILCIEPNISAVELPHLAHQGMVRISLTYRLAISSIKLDI